MYQYVLFDLDGTLTDPKEGICKSVQYALQKKGIVENDLDKLEPFIGPPLTDSFREFYGMDEEEAVLAVETYRERFSVIGLYENEVYQGIPEMLKELQSKEYRLAVASSKPTVFVEKILKYFHLNQYFDVVVGSELDGRRVKKEEVVEEALLQLYEWKDRKDTPTEEEWNAKKSVTVMVGDRKFDVIGAQKAGINSIAVAYGYGPMEELVEAKPNEIASSVKELLAFLLDNKTQKPWEEKHQKMEELAKEKMPKNSFFRAIYMIIPLVIYYLIWQITAAAAESTVSILLVRKPQSIGDWITRNLDNVQIGINILALMIGILVLWLKYHKTESMPEYWLKDSKKWCLFPATFIMGAFLALGLNYLIGNLVTWLVPDTTSLQNAGFNTQVPFWSGLLFYVFVSPVAEEMVFRWLLFGRIKRTIPTIIAMLTTALFFGFYHGNLIQGIYAFLMGLVMVLIYQWSKTFLIPVIFHIAANASVFLTAMLCNDEESSLCSWLHCTPLHCVFYMVVAIGLLFWIKDQSVMDEPSYSSLQK